MLLDKEQHEQAHQAGEVGPDLVCRLQQAAVKQGGRFDTATRASGAQCRLVPLTQ